MAAPTSAASAASTDAIGRAAIVRSRARFILLLATWLSRSV
jgi:hypothetical protein